jgi:uncharacterized protein YutE (UPF0331/DUF86 family)
MTTSQLTDEQFVKLFAITMAEALRDLGEVPNGEFYVRVMPYLSFQSYQAIIESLKRSGVIEERANVLRWIGSPVS